MKLVFITIIFTLISTAGISQDKAYISTEKAVADINYMIKTIEEIHYNPYFKIEKEQFNENKDELLNKFDKDSISLKKEVKIEKPKSVKNIDISFIKPPQKLKVNAQKDTTIVCKEGTKLSIKANSFVNVNGDLIKGNIDLNVTEYYKLSDMLLANLSTTSNGEQLETGGMLNIKASKEGELLKLKKKLMQLEVL